MRPQRRPRRWRRRRRRWRSGGRGGQRALDRLPLRRHPTFGEDEHEGGVAEDLGQLLVGEVDAEAAVAEGQPDAEVEQQRGQAGACREPDRGDRDDEHRGADEQRDRERAQVVRFGRRPRRQRRPGTIRLAPGIPEVVSRPVLAVLRMSVLVSQGVPLRVARRARPGPGRCPRRRRPSSCRVVGVSLVRRSVPADRGRDHGPRASRPGSTCCATTAASRRSTATTSTDLFRRRATCTRRTASSRWTTAGTSPPAASPSCRRRRPRDRPGRSGPSAGAGSPRRSCRPLDRRPGRYLQAYADGVNAYLEARSPSQASLEYVVLGTRVADYRDRGLDPADSLAWLKAMAWDLRGNYDDELARARLVDAVSPARRSPSSSRPTPRPTRPILSAEHWAPAAAAEPAGLVEHPRGPRHERRRRRPHAEAADCPRQRLGRRRAYAAVGRGARRRPAPHGRRRRRSGRTPGSSAGRRSATGQAAAGQRPAPRHLGIPGIWYQVGLHCRDDDRRSARSTSPASRSPGCPGVVIGHNDRIAWGLTNLGPDVSDFFLERVDGRPRACADGTWEPLETRTEIIQVAGGGRRRSRSGRPRTGRSCPTSCRPRRRRRALARPGLEGSAAGASRLRGRRWPGPRCSRARPRTRSSRSTSRRTSPSSGRPRSRSPCRRRTSSSRRRRPHRLPGAGPDPGPRLGVPGRAAGVLAAPGWDAAYDWQGFVPVRRDAAALDPVEGFIVTANQAVTASRTPVPHRRLGLRLPRRSGSATAHHGGHGRAVTVGGHGRDPDGHAQPVRPGARQGAAGRAARRPRRLRRRGRLHQRGAGPAARLGLHAHPPTDSRPARRRPTSTPCGPTCSGCPSTTSSPTTCRPTAAAAHGRGGRRAARRPQSAVVGRQARPPGVVEGRDEILRQAHGRGAPRADRARSARTPTTGAGARCTGSTRPTRCSAATPCPAWSAASSTAAAFEMPAAPRSSTPPAGTPASGYAVDRGAVDAHGRRPRRPRRVDVGQPDRCERPRLQRALRRPDRRLGRGPSERRGPSPRRPCARPPTRSSRSCPAAERRLRTRRARRR